MAALYVIIKHPLQKLIFLYFQQTDNKVIQKLNSS